MVYVRTLSASKDRLDFRATEPVLWPGLTEAQGGEGRGGQYTLLGSVVQILQEAVAHYHREQSSVAELTRQLAAVPSMTSAEVLEIAPTRPQAIIAVTNKLTQKTLELDLVTFLVENAVYVIWSHLDFFMLRAFPRPRGGLDIEYKKTCLLNVSTQDISVLQTGLVSIFNESFCKKIVDTRNRDSSSTDREFVEGLVRRIKRLLQFVPVK